MTTRPRLRRRLTLALAALLVGVTAASCGDDGGGGDQAATTQATGDGDGDGDAGGTATDTATIEDFAFAPERIRVRAGQSVTWTNEDDFDHTVTAEDKAFDSGPVGPGKTFSHTFADAGTVTYVCTIHPYMKATVTVT